MQYRDDELQGGDNPSDSFAAWVRQQLEQLADVPTSSEIEGSRRDRNATIM